MSYQVAGNCFTENVNLIGTPPAQNLESHLQWNLNKGLYQMMESLMRDLAQVQGALAQIRQVLERAR